VKNPINSQETPNKFQHEKTGGNLSLKEKESGKTLRTRGERLKLIKIAAQEGEGKNSQLRVDWIGKMGCGASEYWGNID